MKSLLPVIYLIVALNTNPALSIQGDYCNLRFSQRFKTLQAIDDQLDFLWSDLGGQIAEAKKSIFEARAKGNRNLWAVIASVAAGITIFLAGRNVDDPSFNEADVAENAGRALYSISFMTTRAYGIKQLEFNCGAKNLVPILRRFSYLRELNDLQDRLFNSTATSHPLQGLGPQNLPEVVRLQLNQFQFRAKVALSCLFEDGTGEGTKLLKTINMISSVTSRKLNILASILDDKLEDIGDSASKNNCLSRLKIQNSHNYYSQQSK